MEQDLRRPWSEEFCYDGASLTMSRIVHPWRWGSDDPELIRIFIPCQVLDSGLHPLLAAILAPRGPQICKETALFFLRYLQSGGHSVKTQKSIKPLLKARYFNRLKMRPWLSRFRKRRHRHSSGRSALLTGQTRSPFHMVGSPPALSLQA